jgi:hypothetical protein
LLTKVVDVQPDEHGYDFLHADGSSTYLPRTPESDAYAQQLGEFKDQRLASNDPRFGADEFAPPTATDANTGLMSEPPPPAPAMSVAPPPDAPPAAQSAPEPGPAPGAPPAPVGAPEAPGAPPGPDPLGELALKAAMRPGSAGVTHAQLQAKAGQGVAVPTAASTTVEGAIPYDEQAAAERAQAHEMIRQAHEERALSNVHAAQDEAMALQTQADSINQQIAPARKRLETIEAGVRADEQSYRQLRAKVANGEVDQGRLFRGPLGSIAAIAAVLGSAFGAKGAILGHSQNFAQQIVTSAIDRDVQAQEDDFRRLGMAADNMYRDLMMHYGDADQARTALRGMQLEQAKTLAAYSASRSKSQDAVLAHQEWLANDFFQDSEGERKIREQSYGKMTARTESAVQYPHAGSGPRLDYQRAFENAIKAGTARREDATSAAGIGKTLAETDKTRADATASKVGQIPRGLQAPYSAADSLKSLGSKLLGAYGVKQGEKPGYLKGQLVGAGATLDQEKQRQIDAVWGQFQDEGYKMVTGGVPTEATKHEFAEQTKSWSTSQKLQYINDMVELAAHKQKFIEGQRTGAGGGGHDDEEVELTPH